MNKEIDISSVVLKTDRLLLRAWQESDLDDFYQYASVDGVGQMAGWAPHKDKEESRKILEMFINEKKTFALVYGDKVIGSLGIEKYDQKNFPEFDDLATRELGFVLSKEYWGQGLMSEAVKEVCRYLFEEVKLDQLVCSHFLRNIRSKRVQEKCGFVFYKEYEYHTRMNTIETCALTILTYEHYKELQEVE